MMQAVADKAEEWIGVPFRWQGRVRAGCDCRGLIAGVAKELNRPEAGSLEALAGDYGVKVPVNRLRMGMERLFDRVPTETRQAGDVLLCRLGGAAQHLAIYAPKPGKPDRAIEAMPKGPAKVRPAHWPAHRIDSVWRWRNADS
jgi:cell wall-associated NlpC family hydrolase